MTAEPRQDAWSETEGRPPGRDPRQVGDPRRLIAAALRNRAGLSIELLDNGSLFAIRHGDILVNQVLGSPLEGGLGNVYLRRRARGGVSSFPLLGPASPSRFRASRHGAAWEGSVDGLDYSCTLRLARTEPTWFWTIQGRQRARGRRMSLDAVLAQDLGIAREAAVRSSELYTSQYIDHTILDDEDLGFLVCSRQNLPQGDAFPWIMHGCLDGAVGYLTDGFQLYGLAYKATNLPAALGRPMLPNRNYQYELALPTLQSRRLSLPPGGDRRDHVLRRLRGGSPGGHRRRRRGPRARRRRGLPGPAAVAPIEPDATPSPARPLRCAGPVREPGPRTGRPRAVLRPGAASRRAARRDRSCRSSTAASSTSCCKAKELLIGAADRAHHAVRPGPPPERRHALGHRLDVRRLRLAARRSATRRSTSS